MKKWYENCGGCCWWTVRREVQLICIYQQCWFHPLSIRAEVTKTLATMKKLDTCFT